jgi:hypothetical protein
MADIFISYSRSQLKRVALIHEKLVALGLSVWFDAALHSGENFGDEIKREIEDARAVLVCWEADAKKSAWVRGEATLAINRNKLVPCLLEPTELDPPFNVLHAEDLSAWEGEDTFAAWLKLLERFGEFTDRPGLASYAQIIGEGAHSQPLRKWLEAHGNDPLAGSVRERLGVLDGETARARVVREKREARERRRQRAVVRRRISQAKKKPRGLAKTVIAITTWSIATFATLAVVVYVWNILEATTIRLRKQEDKVQEMTMNLRSQVDRQGNQIARQDRAMRRAYDELRDILPNSATSSSPDAALLAVQNYLQRGRHTFADERIIAAAASGGIEEPSLSALVVGAAELLAWERSGEQLPYSGSELPSQLERAREAFTVANANAQLAPLAQTGLAWIYYLVTSSVRSSYSEEDCAAVFGAVAASAVGDHVEAQPLYWRAQCMRKLGRVTSALADYALAAQRSDDTSDTFSSDAELTLAMNAFHGLGTTLIATYDVPDSEIRSAIETASQACTVMDTPTGSPRMQLARACLARAIKLRELLGHTANEIAGTRENISFAYLRDHDFSRALDNSLGVERVGLYPWNELVRVLAVREDTSEFGREVASDARRNLRGWSIGRYNPCELQKLLDAQLYDEARRIIEEERPYDGAAICPAAP